MKNIKKSLLMSTILLCSADGSWGMDEQDNGQVPRKVLSTLSKVLAIEQGILDPLHYVVQFTIPADEAARLLERHWKRRGFQDQLAGIVGTSKSTLRNLISDQKANKALRGFNIALVENKKFWELFSPMEQSQIILGQLIRITSEEAVAVQLGVSTDHLHFFQQYPVDQEMLRLLPKVEMETWELGAAANLQPLQVNTIKRVSATYDQKAVPGYGCANNLRAIMHIDGEDKFLYGSSDREEEHIPPDISTLSVLDKKQQKHLAQFETVEDVFYSAKPGIPPQQLAKLVSALPVQSSPSPGAGIMYVESQKKKELKKHRHFEAAMHAKLYTNGVATPNFISKTEEDISETHAKCLPKGFTYNEKRERIISCSYQHILPTGRTLDFDWGHGCDHADTLEQQGGILSTSDPDNLVPQNKFYNRCIRNPLVQRIRSAGIGGEYREISLYHHTPYITNETRIPEAFIFIELYNGTPEAAYFFPNLIDYEALDFEKSSRSNYLNYLDLFRINELISYFYIPFVQAQNPIPHMEQCNKGTILSHCIHADITALFNNLTEHALPPRARASLIKTIMNQSINKAAVLDFDGLTSLESAIHYYSNNRIYWELDDRSEEERQASFVSNFSNLSAPVQHAYETIKDKFPEKYKEERAFREAVVRGLGSLVDMIEETDQEIMKAIIGGQSIKNIRLAQKYLKMAHYKIESGDYNNRDLRGIIHILNYTPEFEDLEAARALFNLIKENEAKSIKDEFIALSSSFEDTEMEIQHLFTFEVLRNKLENGIREIRLGNLRTKMLFEMMLILEREPTSQDHFISLKEVYDLLTSMDLLNSTLEEKKKIADFLYFTGFHDEEMEWISKIHQHFAAKPSQKNAILLSSWLREGSGCIKKDIDFSQEILEIANTRAQEKARRKELFNQLLFGVVDQ